MQITAPRIGPFEINLNTVVVLIGFASGFVAWGWTLAEMKAGISKADRIEIRVQANETTLRRVDNLEYRIGIVEQKATDAATAMRAVETTLNVLTTDVRVVKEILQRLEAGQNGRAPPN